MITNKVVLLRIIQIINKTYSKKNKSRGEMCKNRLIKMMIGVKLKKERVIIRIISLIKTLMNLMILTKLFKNRINMVMKSI